MVSQAKGGCSFCKTIGHTKMSCPKIPRKPLKRSPIKRKPVSAVVKPKKKKKAPTRSKLVKKLDAVFSQYIRYSAVERDGLVQCVTCPTRLPPQNMQNGHYQSRGDYPTRWLEDNCHPQCVGCNVFRKGNYTEYAIFMINTYGSDKLNELKALAKSGEKIPTYKLTEMIEDYTKKVGKLLA